MSENAKTQDDRTLSQIERLKRFGDLIQKQTGVAIRPSRMDGYVNLMNRYGTTKDTSEHYQFQAEPAVPDETLTEFYEGNGLFAKIIDAPAEEAIKHGFVLDDVKDQNVIDFYQEALDELDWEETAINAVRWARLFGGSLVVMLVNDGRGIDEPLDWKNIQSIDDLRVYDRSVIEPDYSSMFSYSADDPFRTRGSRLGMPEYYHIHSKYGAFTVHESRCLVFQNGVLPENCSNSVYELWGMPEYIRIRRAIRDSELAHSSGPKMLEKSVQAVYKMKDMSALLSTDEGEGLLLKRLQAIDLARGLLNSIAIDNENEDYDFKTFQFSGVSEIIDTTCNQLSALTSIPQTILFGRSPAGMNSTGESDMENWYSFIERIQKRMLRGNLRYLLSVVFQAGVATGEIEEVPKIKPAFNPLWSLSELEQAQLEQTRAATQQTKAATAQLYVTMEAIDPSEVRKKLAESEDFDVENMLDEYDDEDLFSGLEVPPDQTGQIPQEGDFAEYSKGVSVEEHNADPQEGGNGPDAAPAATKLPQDMSEEELETAAEAKHKDGGPGSGNFNHTGVPGQVGGSAPGPFDSSKAQVSVKWGGKELPKETADKILSLCGARSFCETGKADAEIVKRGLGDKVKGYAAIENNGVQVQITFDDDAKELSVDHLYVDETGKGTGTKVMQDILVEAKAQGYKDVELTAEGRKGAEENGYYTWARMGFDGNLTAEQRTKAKDAGFDVSRVGELMKTEEGRKYWKENGSTIHLSFDVSDGSDSMKALTKYLSEKRRAPQSDESDNPYPNPTEGVNHGSVGVLVISDGKILTGTRHNDFGYGLICGPGGHIENGETAEEAAIRETQEEFGITPTEMFPIGCGPAEPEEGLTPVIFLCTAYDGEIACNDLEMTNPQFLSLEEIGSGKYDLFAPFKDGLSVLASVLGDQVKHDDKSASPKNWLKSIFSIIFRNPIDKSAKPSIIKSKIHNEDGGEGSGNWGHNGVPGETGGSAPTPSARGENQKCKGFENKKTLKWKLKKHGGVYASMTPEQYEKHAIEFLKQPCSENIDGYVDKEGAVCRFDKSTGEYAKGYPGGYLKTCFNPGYKESNGSFSLERAVRYFERHKESEEDDDRE